MTFKTRAMPWDSFIGAFRASVVQQSLNRQHYMRPNPRNNDEFTSRAAAELLGVARNSLDRWRADGWVPLRSVENVADHLGRHPLDLWGDDYLAAAERSSMLRDAG